MKLIPASSARWMMRTESSWSGLPHAPNIIAPRQSGLTFIPVRPRVRCSMPRGYPCALSIASTRPLGAGVDRDLGDADLQAALERVDAEGLVQQRGRLGLELDRGALQDGGAVGLVDLQRLEGAAVEEEQRRVLGGGLAVD